MRNGLLQVRRGHGSVKQRLRETAGATHGSQLSYEYALSVVSGASHNPCLQVLFTCRTAASIHRRSFLQLDLSLDRSDLASTRGQAQPGGVRSGCIASHAEHFSSVAVETSY